MDYVAHFNLTDRPFKNSYDGRYFFRSQAAAAIFLTLKDENCPSIVHLKGQSKAGKTFVLRRLPSELRDSRKVALILNPQFTLSEILRQALTDFGHSHKFTLQSREEELLGYYQNSVTDFLAEGFRILLAVDNAEELSPELLAEIYGLMELESGWRGRVTLLLGGSPDKPWPVVPDIMMEVRELELPALNFDETVEYVGARFKAAGGDICFSRAALKTLWEYSRGLPELINQLAERSLISAWSAGRREVGSANLKAARQSLDNPLTFNRQALAQAARGTASLGAPRQSKANVKPLLWLGGLLVLGGAFYLAFLHQAEPPLPAPAEPVIYAEEEEPSQPATATPAAEKSGQSGGGLALPTLPPQLLHLPQGQQVLVVDQDTSFGQLWQGGPKGPGKKADVATPKFKNGGLYLFGRPKGDQPLVFQFPPARSLPVGEAKILWPRVATLLPQNVLPLIVAPGAEYQKPETPELAEIINKKVRAWVQSQQYRFPDSMAALYASSFQFFELGRSARTVDRESFRMALNSEARTSGEVNLAISAPVIMQDPGNSRLVWAVFNLKYESRLRHDMGLRALIFEKAVIGQDNWSIVAELWLPEKSLSEDGAPAPGPGGN